MTLDLATGTLVLVALPEGDVVLAFTAAMGGQLFLSDADAGSVGPGPVQRLAPRAPRLLDDHTNHAAN